MMSQSLASLSYPETHLNNGLALVTSAGATHQPKLGVEKFSFDVIFTPTKKTRVDHWFINQPDCLGPKSTATLRGRCRQGSILRHNASRAVTLPTRPTIPYIILQYRFKLEVVVARFRKPSSRVGHLLSQSPLVLTASQSESAAVQICSEIQHRPHEVEAARVVSKVTVSSHSCTSVYN